MKLEILQGDCLEVLKTLPDESVNCCVTSPPYAGKRVENFQTVAAVKYVAWFVEVAAELMRVLTSDGSFVLNIKEGVIAGERERYVYELVLRLQDYGWRWVDEFIWHKVPSYPGKWPNRFRDAFERCYHFTKSAQFAMYQDAVLVPVGEWHDTRCFDGVNDAQRMESVSGSGMGNKRDAWRDRTLVYPSNVLTGSPEYNVKFHPAPWRHRARRPRSRAAGRGLLDFSLRPYHPLQKVRLHEMRGHLQQHRVGQKGCAGTSTRNSNHSTIWRPRWKRIS